MNDLKISLVTDGPSDVVLLPIITWLLHEYLPLYSIQPTWADMRPYRCRDLKQKIWLACQYFPCQILFVHRDAEAQPLEQRYDEIMEAVSQIGNKMEVPIVCVVPVRMQETWLLFDIKAIRWAAGNPNGRIPLQLPHRDRMERMDSKDELHKLLKAASELSGRRLSKLDISQCSRRIPDIIEDFSPLRELPAFQRFETHLVETLQANGWLPTSK